MLRRWSSPFAFAKVAAMRGWHFGFMLASALVAGALAWAEPPASGTVARVIDGDTFVLGTGEHVRLLDINTPEIAHHGDPAEPFGDAAKVGLKAMIEGQPVTLEVGQTEYDRYGRVLAHVYTQNGGWVNGGMVMAGLAHVYTFPDNAMYPRQLQALEAQARAAKKGLWALPRWQVRQAETCCAAEDMGRFTLVEGKVQNTTFAFDAKGRRKVYLNFGPDYKTDFTVEVPGANMPAFTEAGIVDIPTAYKGKTVLVRGFPAPINGALIKATHPAQLEVK